jgi:hypothetical protein
MVVVVIFCICKEGDLWKVTDTLLLLHGGWLILMLFNDTVFGRHWVHGTVETWSCSELSSGLYCRVKWLSMEAVRTSETSVDSHFTPQYNPEDSSEHHTRRRENLKSHETWSCFIKCFSDHVQQWTVGKWVICSNETPQVLYIVYFVRVQIYEPKIREILRETWVIILCMANCKSLDVSLITTAVLRFYMLGD